MRVPGDGQPARLVLIVEQVRGAPRVVDSPLGPVRELRVERYRAGDGFVFRLVFAAPEPPPEDDSALMRRLGIDG